jgi:hypothetical protein
MSDFVKIAAARKPVRSQATAESRRILAAEETADALEGIRQDFTAFLHVVGQISTSLANIAHKLKLP